MREHRQKQRLKYGSRMFSAAETRRLLAAANQPLRAMIMLAINCGYGNNDVGLLPLSAVDLKEGWINFPRPKTAVERHSPLWPETIEAVHDAIARRPTPADAEYEEFVFLTRFGFPWAKDIADSPVTKEFTKLLLRVDNAAAKAAKKRGEATPVKIRRKGCNFYALRHSFETVAGGAQDQVAVDRLMGHVDHTMAANYREDVDGRPIEADRLLRVVNHVHAWLWPRPTTDKN
jgi:integrase